MICLRAILPQSDAPASWMIFGTLALHRRPCPVLPFHQLPRLIDFKIAETLHQTAAATNNNCIDGREIRQPEMLLEWQAPKLVPRNLAELLLATRSMETPSIAERYSSPPDAR